MAVVTNISSVLFAHVLLRKRCANKNVLINIETPEYEITAHMKCNTPALPMYAGLPQGAAFLVKPARQKVCQGTEGT